MPDGEINQPTDGSNRDKMGKKRGDSVSIRDKIGAFMDKKVLFMDIAVRRRPTRPRVSRLPQVTIPPAPRAVKNRRKWASRNRRIRRPHLRRSASAQVKLPPTAPGRGASARRPPMNADGRR